MISLLKTSSITFSRDKGDGGYDSSGKWTDSTVRKIKTKGSLQPFGKGKGQVILPEGITQNDAKTYYTKKELKTSSQFTETKADTCCIGGLEYEVFFVEDWNFGLSVDHFECTLIRKDLPTGGS